MHVHKHVCMCGRYDRRDKGKFERGRMGKEVKDVAVVVVVEIVIDMVVE